MIMEGALICGIVFFCIYKIFELFVRREERIRMIEKLSENIDPATIEKQLKGMSPLKASGFGSLKAGCLFTGLGIALLVAFTMVNLNGLDHNNWENKEAISVIYGSCVLLFGGISLLVAFIIELKLSKKKEE